MIILLSWGLVGALFAVYARSSDLRSLGALMALSVFAVALLEWRSW